MSVRLLCFLTSLAVTFGLAARSGLAQESAGNAQDKTAIAKNAEAFVEAFHKGDAKALATFWTPDGDYTTQTGRTIKGREALEIAFQTFFAENKGQKVRIDSDSLRFVTPDVAIEDGTTETLSADGSPSKTRYTIVHVKKDGKWLVSSVRDAVVVPASNADNLRVLEWMLGDWVGKTETGEFERLSVAWSEDQSFIVATIRTTLREVTVAGATHWIGWDPISKNVRSWLFDAGGGFGDGAWTKDGNRWIIRTASVLPDGKKATATYQLTPVDGETITLQASSRITDGKPIPDVKEIKFKRTTQP